VDSNRNAVLSLGLEFDQPPYTRLRAARLDTSGSGTVQNLGPGSIGVTVDRAGDALFEDVGGAPFFVPAGVSLADGQPLTGFESAMNRNGTAVVITGTNTGLYISRRWPGGAFSAFEPLPSVDSFVQSGSPALDAAGNLFSVSAYFPPGGGLQKGVVAQVLKANNTFGPVQYFYVNGVGDGSDIHVAAGPAGSAIAAWHASKSHPHPWRHAIRVMVAKGGVFAAPTTMLKGCCVINSIDPAMNNHGQGILAIDTSSQCDGGGNIALRYLRADGSFGPWLPTGVLSYGGTAGMTDAGIGFVAAAVANPPCGRRAVWTPTAFVMPRPRHYCPAEAIAPGMPASAFRDLTGGVGPSGAAFVSWSRVRSENPGTVVRVASRIRRLPAHC
jgi:hypothetical protein